MYLRSSLGVKVLTPCYLKELNCSFSKFGNLPSFMQSEDSLNYYAEVPFLQF